ncbi:MAG: translation initiation factor IF-2 [Oligosphaeraceae bacterium]|nr:translation initiation factor IF-2 [Oligosphaeraceae bacterium]
MTPTKIRVYELARELGLTNKELLSVLEQEGFAVRSHSSNIEEDDADLIRRQIIAERQKEREESVKPAPAAEAAPAAPAGPEASAVAKADKGGKEIHLKTPITVRDLADALGKKPNELIGMLMTMNIFAAINQVLDVEKVETVCERYGRKFVRERREKPQEKAPVQTSGKGGVATALPQKHVGRPPVVVFMGHVDHGKTSLQDYIRKTKVTAGESGGITQHIGASVAVVGEQSITFLDTPGHAAFTAMRARGANATDIAVLVVAATEGVMPQTIEAINHAKAAGVPIIVAMNKMDLPGANADKVFLGLQQNGITPEEWGGETATVPVSAMTGAGIDDLLERILLEAEMLQLSADLNAPFEGLIIEAQMEAGMGPTAHVLVRNGVLRVGDSLICGQAYGRVKALLDSSGKRLSKAGPSTPVKIMGLSAVPDAGDIIRVCANEREAKALAEAEIAKNREGSLQVERSLSLNSLEDWFNSREHADEKQELSLILKTDVKGSLEALADSIQNLHSEKISAKIVHSGVGEITETDVILAAACKAIIMGFHVRVMPGVNRLAKQKGVDIRLYSIIYELLDELKDAMRGRLTPEVKEQVLGSAEIIQVFNITKAGKICGCRVSSGVVKINAKAKVYRDKELIYHGQVQTLKHFRDDVKEVKSGLECGIRLDNFEDFEVGDRIEVFSMQEIAPEL